MACKFTFKNQDGETVTLDEAGFKAWLADGGAQFVASRHGVDVFAKDDSGSDEQQPAKRFEIGATLTKEQRKTVLASLVDVYKQKGAEKETRINANGDEYLAYPHQPELFEKSDITGAMVRYYVSLPDGRIAHPTELFPDYTLSDIEAAVQKQRGDEERDRRIARDMDWKALDANFSSPEADSAYWQKLSDDSKKQTAHGSWSIAPPSERIMFTKDGVFYSLYKDAADQIKALQSRGWKPAQESLSESEVPAWHTKLPDSGKPITEQQAKNYQSIPSAIASEAYDAVRQDQFLAGGKWYAYLMPASGRNNGVVRFVPEDQNPPKPWKLVNPEGIRIGGMTREQVAAKVTDWLRREPILGDPSAPAETKTGETAQYQKGDRITADRDVTEGDIVEFDGKQWMAKVKRGVTIPLLPFENGKPVVSADTVRRINVNDHEVTHTGTNYYGYGGQAKPEAAQGSAAADHGAMWDAMTPSQRFSMLDKWAGQGQTDAGERYKDRKWSSFNVGEQSSLRAMLDKAEQADPVAQNEAEPKQESPRLNMRDTVKTADIITPAGAIKSSATNGAARIWYHQGDPNHIQFAAKVTFSGKPAPESAVKEWERLKKAQESGYRLTNRRAGSLGTVWTLDKDGRTLTRDGFNAIDNPVFARPERENRGPGYDNMASGQATYATKLAEWFSTLPESTLRSASALATKIGQTPIGKWAKVQRDRNGEVRFDFDDADGKLDLHFFGRGTYLEQVRRIVALAGEAKNKGDREWFQVAADAEKLADAHNTDDTDVSSMLEQFGFKSAPAAAQSVDYANRIHTTAVHAELFARIVDGEVSADEFKASFESLLKNKEAIVAELTGMTKDALFKRFPGLVYRYKNEKKADVVNAAFRDMMDDFTLGAGYSYGMSSGSRDNAIRTIVERTTDQTLADYAKAVQDAHAEREAKISKAAAGMQDPQTLDDFQRLIQARAKDIGGAVTFQQARMTLTPEQRERFDTLAAEKSRDERRARADQQKTEVRVAAQTTEGQVIETKHTKTGEPLFVVKSAERVERDTYNQWNATAKRMGGWYSSFRGNGAVPGFQFKTRENADAFLQYLGGNTEQAKEVVQERRDAYADDRSQSATERLNEMAAALEDKADASLSVERKANTDRRARQAASAEAAANSDKAMAQTMRNIAAAIESGKAKFLDRIRQKVQVETLYGFVNTAQSDKLRALYPSYAEQQKHQGEKPNAETADYVSFPTYTAFRSDLASLGRALLETDGTKKLGQQIMKVADDVSDAYLKFAKENIDKVSSFRTKDGARAALPSKAMAEAAIQRSGYKGAAIVLPVKRNENLIILSPSEAIKRGVWTGDNDRRITLSAEIGAEIVEKLGKINRRNRNSTTAPWQFESAYDKRKRLAGMGIETPAELRAAVREFIALREAPKEADKIKEMERAMIGRRNDGLDFFPTPATIADEMVETAGIEPGMSVLEPSAGMGHIAERIRAAGVDPDVVELANERKELLEAKGFRVIARDFMSIEPRTFFTFGDIYRAPDGTVGVMRGVGHMGSNRVRLEDEQGNRLGLFDRDELTGVEHRGVWSGYDRILMNPPFGDRRDAAHVQHAYELLKPGGRLVSIMGEGVFFGSDKKAQAFRDWLEQVGATDEKLDEGTFMDPSLPVNTATNARMVVIDKPGTAPAPVAEPADSQPADAAFSRTDGLSDRQAVQRVVRVQRVVDGIKAKWNNAPEIIVVSDMQDPQVPQRVRDLDAEMKSNGATGEPRGFITAGKVYIVAGQHKSVEDVTTTVAHEVLGHAGLRGLYGEALNPILRQIVNMRRAEVNAKVKEYGFDPKSERDLMRAAEEVLANMAQTQPELGFVKRAIAAIRNWLRDNGLNLKMTDSDIVAKFILPARSYIEGGRGTGGGRGDEAFSRAKQTDSEAFRKWFGNSKVVDADGKPLVVYHGTTSDFNTFDISKFGQVDQGEYGTGFYFATDTNDADYYAGTDVGVTGGNVMPVFVSLQNPYHTKHGGFGRSLDTDSLIAQGFDGVIAEDEAGTPIEVVAFKPEQIKSAIGNDGEFDPENADIMFSRTVEMRSAVSQRAADLLTTQKTFNDWWHKTVGTQYHKAQIDSDFRPAFDAVQNYLQGTATFANSAADLADRLIPQLNSIRDLWNKKQPSQADIKAISSPIFAGTLEDERVYDAAELRDRFKLNQSQIDLYVQFRAAVDKSLDDLGKTDILRYAGKDAEHLRDEVLNATTASRAAIKVAAHLNSIGKEDDAKVVMDKGMRVADLKDKGYAPLTRFGRYTVYVTEGDEQLYFSLFESEAEANAMARQMKADHPGATVSQGVLSEESYKLFNGISPDTLELFAGALGAEKNEIVQEYIKLAKSNRDAMKRLLKRKGMAGFSEDVPRILASFITSNARQAATNVYGGDMDKAAEAIPKQKGDVKDEAIKMIEFARNPTEDAAKLRGLLFVQYIGGSVASAVVNMTQPITMSLPYLHQFSKRAPAELAKAMKHAAIGGELDPELKQALKRAEIDGVVSPQEIHQLQAEAVKKGAGIGALARMFGVKGDLANRMDDWSKRGLFIWGSVFSMAEQFNRRATFIAAYNIARQNKEADPFAFAEKAVVETQGIYNRGNRPDWARGSVGATLFTFKQYSISYMEFLKRLPKKERAIALAILVLAAGLQGVPFADDLDDLIDTLAQQMGYAWNTKAEKEKFAASMLGQTGADFVLHGTSALPGVPLDFAARLGMANLLPGTGMLLKNKTDKSGEVFEVLGPAGGVVQDALRGEFLPIALRNMLKAADMAQTGMYRDYSGKKVVESDGVDAAMKLIGFNPARVAREGRSARMDMQDVQLTRNVESEIAEKMAQGVFTQDKDAVAEARETLADWNRKNPDKPIVITSRQIMQRVKKMAQTRRERLIASSPKELRGGLVE